MKIISITCLERSGKVEIKLFIATVVEVVRKYEKKSLTSVTSRFGDDPRFSQDSFDKFPDKKDSIQDDLQSKGLFPGCFLTKITLTRMFHNQKDSDQDVSHSKGLSQGCFLFKELLSACLSGCFLI